MEESVISMNNFGYDSTNSQSWMKLPNQTINFRLTSMGEVKENSVGVFSENITVIPSAGTHVLGSSKVKLKNLIDYSWENKFYPGQILAVHVSGTYIAYGIKSKDSGIIRVLNVKTSERALIKGIGGMIQDIAFSFSHAPILLACVDSIGDVYVYKVEGNHMQALSYKLMVHIVHDKADKAGNVSSISWCPYVPEDNESEDDPAKLIVTRGNKAFIWNVYEIHELYGVQSVAPVESMDGLTTIEVTEYTIVDVAFSPDGSTIALACSDGGIRFFQAETSDRASVCIHDWRPHDGKPVSCLFFLDDHLDTDGNFWKFAITGVEGNTELKIWTCESWSCLQTVKFDSAGDSNGHPLKVAVDITANYLLISDITRRLLYVWQLSKNTDETIVCVRVISEFLMSTSILSFGIVKARQGYFTDDALLSFDSSVTVFNDDEVSGGEVDVKKNKLKTMIKLYLVQPKALHECIIVYDSIDTTRMASESMMINKEYEDRDVVEVKMLNGSKEPNDMTTLLSPRALSSLPNGSVLPSNERFLTVSDLERHVNSIELINESQDNDTEEECIVVHSNREDGGAVISTGSSPSMEVQNILFSSEIDEDNCSALTLKACAGSTPTKWPPVPESNATCSNMSDILRNNKADSSHIKMDSGENTSFPGCSKIDHMALNKGLEALEMRFSELSTLVKKQEQDMKQYFGVLHRDFVANQEETKKKIKASSIEDEMLQNRLIAAISQNVNSMLNSEVEFLIKQEINANVIPSLKNSMDNFGQHLQMNMGAQMTSIDQSLKEYIMKLVHKKSVMDTLASAVAAILPSLIQDAFNEVFCKTILPKFEKSCHEMFDQINNLFLQGTRDYLNAMQSNIRSYEDTQCAILHSKMEEFIHRLNETSETSSVAAIKSMEPKLTNAIKVSLDEQKRYLESYILSISKTSPASSIHGSARTIEDLEELVAQRKYEKAIEEALSASDLKLLVSLCERLDPDQLFEPCTIKQNILLSFIQQLSVDFHLNTDLKHKFIEGAVLNLDRKHSICETFLKRILPTVRTRIAQFIADNPNYKNMRNIKMLLMAVDSLLVEKNEV